MLLRTIGSRFNTRETEDKEMFVEGYFRVFGSEYRMWDGAVETVDPHRFDDTIGDDIRCLTNHKSELVLGRTKAGTLQLRLDEYGLFGRVTINPNDRQAVDLYERVRRGDVDQCSFGFDILEQEFDYRQDGSVYITLKKVKLYEVSVVTFPAYEDTYVQARHKDYEADMVRRTEEWKQKATLKLKGISEKWH